MRRSSRAQPTVHASRYALGHVGSILSGFLAHPNPFFCPHPPPAGAEATDLLLQQRSAAHHPQELALSQKWLTGLPSVFKFASPSLEHSYQQFAQNTVATAALTLFTINLVSWALIWYKLAVTPAAARAKMPPLAPLALGCFVPALATTALIVLRPASYKKRYAAINLALSALQLGYYNHQRAFLLWLQSMHVLSGTWRTVSHFLVENLFFTLAWLRVLLLPSTPLGDTCLMAVLLLLNLAGNPRICREWGGSLLMLSSPSPGGPVKAVFAAALPQRSPASAWAAASLRPGRDTCDAVLAFWEILGWLWACLVLLVAEVVRRRAFLAANLHLLGPHAHKAHLWPLGSARLLLKLLCVVLALYNVAALLWAGVLAYQ